MKSKSLDDTLQGLGDKGISLIQESMTDKGVSSLQKRMEVKTTKKSFAIVADKSVYWANYGRPSEAALGHVTKFPPFSIISDWMDRKGIEKQRLFPICYHIKVYGTKGKFYLAEPEIEIIKLAEKQLVDYGIKTITHDNSPKTTVKY